MHRLPVLLLVVFPPGLYSIVDLLVGYYKLIISKPGFRTDEFTPFELEVGQTRTIDVQMRIASSTQEVSISSARPALKQSVATLGGVVESTQIANLPLNGRAWTSLLAQVPGAIVVVRAEGFNIFNRAQYGSPNGNLSTATFGRITTTINGTSPTGGGTPREFEFSLRLRF